MGEESACVWDRGLLSRMYKELKKNEIPRKESNTPMNKWSNEMNRQHSEW